MSAGRHGSRLDSDLAILDLAGRELAWVDDTAIYGDAHLEFTFEKTGVYIARVGSLTGGGNYRFTVGELPYARRTLPAGLEAGTPTEFSFLGTHLDRVDEIWIGDRLAKGDMLSRTPAEVRARFVVPRGTPEGRYVVHLSAAGKEVALPTGIRVSALREITVLQDTGQSGRGNGHTPAETTRGWWAGRANEPVSPTIKVCREALANSPNGRSSPLPPITSTLGRLPGLAVRIARSRGGRASKGARGKSGESVVPPVDRRLGGRE